MPASATTPPSGRRAAALAGAMVALALGAHVAAGGTLPQAGPLALLVLGLTVVGLVVARARLPRALALALVGATQLGAHEGLVLTAGWAPAATDAACAAGHAHAAVAACAPSAHTTGTAAGPAGESGTMLLLHVLATVAGGLLLAQHDRLVALATAAWQAWSSRPLPTPLVLGRPTAVLPSGGPRVVTSALRSGVAHPRRGPPRVLRAALLTA